MMETFFHLVQKTRNHSLRLLIIFICFCRLNPLSGSPIEWIDAFQSQVLSTLEPLGTIVHENQFKEHLTQADVALSCKPEVNVSLGQDGYAVLTALLLVNAPEYPAFQYDVDIMGPLNDTAYCAQLGQELMVVVTDPTGNSCMSTVFIEDKLRPVLTCTPDTVPCNVDIQTLDFELYLDDVTDNCDPDPDVFYSYVIQNLPCNPNGFTQQILVTWTATDASGNSATCQDVIYLRKPALGQIVFPPDVTVSCLTPSIDPSITGEPTFNGEPLGFTCQIVVFHTDNVVPMCNGAQKIIRMWTVMDMCTSGQITDVQEIRIIDNQPPVITCPPSITLNTSPGVCTTKYTLPLPPIVDACADESMIDVDIFVSTVPGIFSPGTMVNLGLGTSLITIRATDPCGNSSTCHYNVTVRDITPPIPVCHSLTIGVGPMGMAILVAANLDFPITENCGILSKQIWRMNNACNTPEDLVPGPDVKFCCADVGDTVMVAFKVTDLSGNMNTCMFQVIVKDQLPPDANCQDITISVTDDGSIIVSPDDINDGSTDNCLITDLSVDPGTFDCQDIGDHIVVLTVTDQGNNTATCTATVTITDEIPPLAECQDITVTLDSSGNASISADQIDDGSSDNCAIDTLTLNISEFDCDDEGEVVVTLTVVDFAGNTATCTATVTVLTTPPVAECNDITVSLNSSGTVTITPDQIDDGSFDDCGIDSLSVTPSTFDCSDTGEVLVILTVTDLSGNTSTCTAIVTIEDTLPPLAVCQDISIMLDSNGMATITASQIDGGSSDNCDTITLSASQTEFDCTTPGPNVVTLTVTDGSGNTSTCTAIVTVMMPDPPNAECQDITVTLGPDGIIIVDPEDVDDGSTAQCGDVTFDLDIDTFDCEDLGANLVILTVTDEAGGTATCTAIITVNEGPPVASCQDITVNVNADGIVIVLGVQINDGSTDDCGIEEFIISQDTFDCTDLGDNIVTLTVTDSMGNSSTCTAIVTVSDNLPPEANCKDITVNLGPGGTITITGADVNDNSTDNCSITGLTVNPPTFDCEDVGDNLVILTVTDQSGNTATCTATVTITSSPPEASCQDITVSLGPGGFVVIEPEDVDDGSSGICDDSLDFSISQDSFDCTEIGDNVVILTVTDESGETSTCTATVTVIDDLDPICSAASITVFVDENGNASITAIMINDGSSDNCGVFTLSVDPANFTCEDLGENIVILTVTDDSGNSSTCSAIVTVEDDIDPICNAQDITVSVNGSSVTVLPSQVDDGSSDNCGDITLDLDPNTFDCEDLGDNLVVLTVTDESGNTSTCTAIVTVNDDESLVANCQNVVIILDANGNASIDPEDIDDGSGGGCLGDTLEFDLTQTDFNCTDVGPNIVILTVTDQDGNTATCSATVTVQDITPPQITCPANLTVDCDAVTDFNNTSQFGNATATDNCPGVQVTETHVLNLNDCNVGNIVRTFTATDASGNTATCIQVVTVTNPNPFTADDITWPPSPITVNICNSTNPPNTGQPTFDPESLQCANPVATFSDMVQTFIDNDPNTLCKIITRTWTVTDNCQPNGTFTFVQTINVTDPTPPVFTNINDMTKVANENCVAFFTLIASATDCAGVTITNNSPFGATSGANASGNYPIGSTTVIFTATDGCGNIATMDVVLTVTDTDPTEFMCEKVIVILPEELEITLPAVTFVTFIEGNCTDENDFIVSYSEDDPFDTLRTYDCGDVGVSTFSLWIWDLSGTTIIDSCHTADLDLRDPDDFCMDGLILFGNVDNEDGLGVSGVQVFVVNAPMDPAMTNGSGAYFIDGFNEGVGYEVSPFRDDNHREGVSTLDLVIIQKHLLGRSRLNSPYKMIAADANKSNHITALDLLEIRKLILGTTVRFAYNTSWRFIDKDYQFPDPFNPFFLPFAETIWFDSIAAGIDTANFIGVKVGDVNGSYFQKVDGPKIEQRVSNEYKLRMQVVKGEENNNHLNLTALNGQGILEGLQFSMYVGKLSNDQLQNITSEVLSPEDWIYDAAAGMILISWVADNPIVMSNQIIISIPLEGATYTPVFLTDQLEAEAYLSNEESTEVASLSMKWEDKETLAFDYQLFQNKPNPFSDGTVISFMLPQEENIRLVIYDPSGKEVFEHVGKYYAGKNEINIKSSDLTGGGMFYYTLITSNASLTRKMSFTND